MSVTDFLVGVGALVMSWLNTIKVTVVSSMYSCCLKITANVGFKIFLYHNWLLQELWRSTLPVPHDNIDPMAFEKCDNLGLLNVKDLT